MAARGVSAVEGPGRQPDDETQAAKGGASTAAAAGADPSGPGPSIAGGETVLGNCARCGSGERLKFCSRCQAVRYCSSNCQKADVRGGTR